MIQTTHGDILDAAVSALVNTVNCVGIMGRGVALQFKRRFPDNFEVYASACKKGEVQPGHMLVYETGQLTWPQYIINFPTKRHWKGKSRIEDIQAGLNALIEEVRARHIDSIALPPLGSGLDGLPWDEVRPLIERAFQSLPDVEVRVFEPGFHEPDVAPNPSREAPKLTAGTAALVGLMHRYLAALMDPFVTLLEVHKQMYFLQEAGEPLSLKFVKATYGPYAENLRHLLSRINGHLISGYDHPDDAPERQLELVPGAVRDTQEFLKAHPDTLERFDRVAKLVEGFETPRGLELLATVHWIAVREGAKSDSDLVAKTHAWNERKRSFSRDQILLAAGRLRQQGWIPANA